MLWLKYITGVAHFCFSRTGNNYLGISHCIQAN
jgi:hypothetical protein